MILNAPTCVNYSPTDIITSFVAIINSVERNTKRLKKLIDVIILPATAGLILPVFDTMKREEGVNTKNTIIKGSCTVALATASPPNPRLRTSY